MTDNRIGVVLVFLQEVIHTREGDLVDILIDLLSCHTDTTVADGKCSFLFIQ